MDQAKQLAERGYFVVADALAGDECASLLRTVVAAFGERESVIKEPAFRRHTPLLLTSPISEAITAVVEHGHDAMAAFLRNDQLLVELSSITVFPHAAEQPLHRDEANAGSYLMSVFVALADTTADAGALVVLPGSHDMERGASGEPVAIELSRGSAVFMNSKLLHGGGSNLSPDRIRPVFYFSFGEADLYGPTYSIAPEVARRQLTLDEFRPRVGQRRAGWTAESRPQLSAGCRLLTPVSDSDEVMLCAGDSIRATRRFAGDTEWQVDALLVIEHHPRELEAADLARQCSVDLATMLTALADLGRAGWVRW